MSDKNRVSQLKLHIGKPFTTRDFPCYLAWKNETQTAVVCFDYKAISVTISSIHVMRWRHKERLIAVKNPNNRCLKLGLCKLFMSFSQPIEWTVQKIKAIHSTLSKDVRNFCLPVKSVNQTVKTLWKAVYQLLVFARLTEVRQCTFSWRRSHLFWKC